MKMFYVKFLVIAGIERTEFSDVEKIYAHGWIKCVDENSALLKSKFEIESDGLKIDKMESPPVCVTRENFVGKNTGLEQFDRATTEGIAFFYVAVGEPVGEASFKLKRDSGVDIGHFYRTQSKLFNKGRCLHFDAGQQCNAIIKAHSVQKGQSLSAIAKNSEVYGLADRLTTDGQAQFIKKGIKTFSIFKGFCKYHDNDVFKPIDRRPLVPSEQQVALYAYRSICREVFVKESSQKLYDSLIKEAGKDSPLIQRFKSMLQGTTTGFMALMDRKRIMYEVLEQKMFAAIEYLVIECPQEPTMSFSGLFYPEFDFQGRELQNLAATNCKFSLMTFCSAPTDRGWAVVFAWHKDDAAICR
ncbi:MAG: hypothetical protein MJK04_11890, partial [Psychrosphaera sp.]|nr:hypothetical protein [Psychrosphaera sp.]